MNATSSIAASLAAHGVAYSGDIAAAALRNRLDPRLLAAVAAQETGGPGSNSGRNIVGDGGHGHGLFQIDDRYHAFARTPGAMQPAANAEHAAEMLRGLLDRYGGDTHAALSAYNAGDPRASGTTTRWSDGATLGYADSVLRHESQLEDARAALPEDTASASNLALAASGAASTAATAVLPLLSPAQPAPNAPPDGEQPYLDELAREARSTAESTT